MSHPSRFLFRPFLIAALLSTSLAQAADKFKPAGSCGSANVVSGNTCSNVKVQFQFEGCSLKSEPEVAKRVICEKQTILARYSKDNYRYEAQFEKVDDGWGGITWKPIGTVTQFEKVGASPHPVAHATTHHPTETVAVAPMPTLEAPSERGPAAAAEPAVAPSGSPFKFGAFFDFRYSSFTAPEDLNNMDPNAESGFGLEDGAVYANYESGKVAVVADLAFRRAKDSDVNLSSKNSGESNTNFIALGTEKSQLYVRYKLHPMLTFDAGQFDTPLGIEVNDSKDRVFGKTAYVSDTFLPFTHAGAMAEFTFSGAYLRAIAANPNARGTNGPGSTPPASATAGDTKTEYGAVLGYANEMIRGQLGYLTRPIVKANATEGLANKELLEATAGVTLGSFAFDAEYDHLADPNKNSLTPIKTDRETAAEGWLGIATWKIIEPLQVGLRYETATGDPANKPTTALDPTTGLGQQVAVSRVESWGGSVHYKLSPELETRAEYIGYNFKSVEGLTWKDTRFNVAAIVTF